MNMKVFQVFWTRKPMHQWHRSMRAAGTSYMVLSHTGLVGVFSGQDFWDETSLAATSMQAASDQRPIRALCAVK